jgi:hypothetical protein
VVLTFNQKKAENNKINHKMYMMQNLNKFKKDKIISEESKSETIFESTVLQSEKQFVIKQSDAA